MNNLARQKLTELINNHGVSLCQDYSMCETLIQEYFTQYPTESFLLINSFRQIRSNTK